MKRIFLPAAGLLLFLAAAPAHAQHAYGLSEIEYNPETATVSGYSATGLDYLACYYYAPYVEGYLFQGAAQVDSGADLGTCLLAEVFTETPATTDGDYTVWSDHYVVAYFFDPGLGYYDPYGFGGYGGEYGSNESFLGCECGGYEVAELIYLGSTAVSIELPCDKTPSLSPRRTTVTRGQTATFTLQNLCTVRSISDWKFIDQGHPTVMRTTHPGSATWSGVMATSGTVAVTVTQGGTTFTPIADVTVANRTSGFRFQPATPAKSAPPIQCDTPLGFAPGSPIAGQKQGWSCAQQRASWVSTPVADGPNAGYRYAGSATNQTQYVFTLHPDAQDPASLFYRAQCGDYDPVRNQGFTSGAQYLADITNHESGATNSHYQIYVDAQNKPENNVGLGLEAVVVPPNGGDNTRDFNDKAGQVADARQTQIAAAQMEPCGTSGARGPNCEYHGAVNFDRIQQPDGSVTARPFVPCRPSGLSATAASSTRVDLTWSDNSFNEDGFHINRATAGGELFLIKTVGANQTSYSDTTASASTDYTYTVQAFAGAVDSFDSAPASVHTPASGGSGHAPAPPTGAAAAAAASTQVTVTWTDASSDEDGFKIERRTGSGSYAQIATVGPNVTRYADGTVSPSTTYTYRVRAYNAGGDSPYSGEVTATTPAGTATVPVAPSGLAATAVSGAQVSLAWSDNSSNETGFKIERRAGAGAYAQIATVGANVTAYSDTGLAPATTYTYRVRATNAAGDSAYSAEASATTPAPPAGPAAPSNLVLTAVSSGQVNLNWTDNSANETGFKIERRTGSGAYAQIAAVGANVAGYADASVAAATSYTYRVKAYNGNGDSLPSNEASITTSFTMYPAPPSGLTATAPSATEVDLAWMDNSYDETGFQIDRATGNGAFSPLATVYANATSYRDASVASYTTYTYRVKALGTDGDSTYASATVTTPTAPGAGPAPPCCLVATAGASGGYVFVSLTWTDRASDETGYLVERRDPNGTLWSTVASLPADSASLGDSTVSPSSTYVYRVAAYKATGRSYSAEVLVTTPDLP